MSNSKFSFFYLILIFGSLMFFTSCVEEEEITENSEEEFLSLGEFPGVDPALWSHFSNFEAEAAARGLDIDLYLANITGEISEIDEEHVAGQCTYSSAAPNGICRFSRIRSLLFRTWTRGRDQCGWFLFQYYEKWGRGLSRQLLDNDPKGLSGRIIWCDGAIRVLT